jgi:hypothetical protein
MKKIFTKQEIIDTIKQPNLCSFISNELTSIYAILDSEIPLKDKAWFIIEKCDLTPDQKRFLALQCIKIVVKIYNKKYPNDTRLNDCVNAIELFNEGKITKLELLAARNAAYSAATKTHYSYDDAIASFSDLDYDHYGHAVCAVANSYAGHTNDSFSADVAAIAATYAVDDADLLSILKDFVNESNIKYQ